MRIMISQEPHVTVRASSAGTTGGTLFLRLGRPAGTDLAAVNITPTGGWNAFQDFTVPLDADEISQIGNAGFPLLAVVDSEQTTYQYDLQSFKFERSDVGTVIEAESFDRERYPSYDDDIFISGNKVINLLAEDNWMEYDAINFVGGAASIKVRASSGNPAGGTLVIYNGRPGYNLEIGRVRIGYTGGWNNFQDFVANIPQIPGGVADISFAFEGGEGNLFELDHFEFGLNPFQNVGNWINAAAYDVESAEGDQNVIRDMVTKVGYIKNRPAISPAEYFLFTNFGLAGAKTVTVRYSSGGTGGVLKIQSPGSPTFNYTLASLNLPPTGGWNTIREITVPVDQFYLGLHNGQNLIFSIPETGTNTNYKFDIHAFRFNP
jgi:Carbohydrate binding module (family 6)